MNDEIYARHTRKIVRSQRAYDCKYESTRVECPCWSRAFGASRFNSITRPTPTPNETSYGLANRLDRNTYFFRVLYFRRISIVFSSGRASIVRPRPVVVFARKSEL